VKPKEVKLPGGKRVRVSTIDNQGMVEDALANEAMLELHLAQIDIYEIKGGKVKSRQFMPYNEAVQFGKEVKEKHNELGYRIIQVVK